MSTENVVANPVGHASVRELLDRYTNAINERSWAAVENVFAEDGVWDLRGIDRAQVHLFRGRHAVATGIEGLMAGVEQVIQMNHAPMIHVEGDHATARSTMHETSWMNDGTRLQLFGFYHDSIVKERDGEWRFAERQFWMARAVG